VHIAALIAAHDNPEALERLLNRLDTPLWTAYVHIDAKSQFSRFSHLKNKAQFSDVRIPVYWGGLGLVKGTLRLMRMALDNPATTHVYLMSGECFPIKEDDYIRRILSQSDGNFLTYVKMPIWHKPLDRLERWHFSDTNNVLAQKLFRKISWYVPRRDVNNLLRGIQPFGGSAWWLLNRETGVKILDYLQNNKWYIHAFRNTFCPDEIFFQTLVLHLGITPDRVSPTATKWKPGAAHPEIVTPAILDEMKKDWHFSARKFVNPLNTSNI
jgi:Core-2/I-Branching enzyme